MFSPIFFLGRVLNRRRWGLWAFLVVLFRPEISPECSCGMSADSDTIVLEDERKAMKVVYLVEVQGQGFAPYEFDTEKEAKDYVMGIVSWSGRKWRIVKKRVNRV